MCRQLKPTLLIDRATNSNHGLKETHFFSASPQVTVQLQQHLPEIVLFSDRLPNPGLYHISNWSQLLKQE